jgi:hypothetical protein
MPYRWIIRAVVVSAVMSAAWMAGAAAQGGGAGPARDAAAIPAGTGAIGGSVVAEGSGTPVRRARVTLAGSEIRGGRSVLTDDLGAFEFALLPSGRFTITASKAGFVDNTYGAKSAGRPGTPIQLAEGQRVSRAVISLPRGSVITGIVLDDHGEPAAGTQVRALRYVMRTGEKTLQQVGQDQADDRGMYRIYQLQPGDYVVNALPRNVNAGNLRATLTTEITTLLQQAQNMEAARGRVALLQEQLAQAQQEQPEAYAPVYYPGTTSVSTAATISLGVSEERAGVDFQLPLVPTARVRGAISSADGILPQGTQVALVPADQAGLGGIRGLGANVTRVGPTGEFAFNNVTPGEYEAQARATIRQAPANAADAGGGRGRGGRGGAVQQVFWGSAPVSVGGQDVSGVTLDLRPGMTISGRVEFVGSSAPPGDLSLVRVGVSPRGTSTFEIGGTQPAQADATGRFTVPGVAPGHYVLTATMAGGRGAARGGAAGAAGENGGQWQLSSAMVNGQDALDFPIEIGPNQDVPNAVLTFTDETQGLSGTIQDTIGRPTADFTIIVFPSDSRYWLPQARRISSTRPGTDGRFSFAALPPGDYRLTAVTDVEPGEWYDPDFLAQLRQVSIPISLVAGQNRVQDIRLAGN